MRILGIDYGTKRIGLSLSDPTKTIASSYGRIERKGLESDLSRIAEIVLKEQVEAIVVGIPVSLSGERGKSASDVEGFMSELGKKVAVPVLEWDERFTTSIGEGVLIESDMSRRKRKKVIDGMAAGIMLQGYLDSKK